MALCLSRKVGQDICIGPKGVQSNPIIRFSIVAVRGDTVRIAIKAPQELDIWREQPGFRNEADGQISFEVPLPGESIDARQPELVA